MPNWLHSCKRAFMNLDYAASKLSKVETRGLGYPSKAKFKPQALPSFNVPRCSCVYKRVQTLERILFSKWLRSPAERKKAFIVLFGPKTALAVTGHLS